MPRSTIGVLALQGDVREHLAVLERLGVSVLRVRRTEDVVKVGDSITVKCVGIDERSGKVRLSRKAAMQELEAQKQAAAPAAAPVSADTPAPIQS